MVIFDQYSGGGGGGGQETSSENGIDKEVSKAEDGMEYNLCNLG